MNNKIEMFNHEQFGDVSVRMLNNEVYFLGNDITKSLGYKNSRKALKDHCKRVVQLEAPHPQSQTKTLLMNFIPEPDLYRLVANSKLPSAEKFEEWIFEEVLPSIRNNGGYIANQESMTPEQIVANALIVAQNIIKDKELQLEQANEVIEIQKPKVQAWEKLMDSKNNLNMSQVAKAFSIPGLGRNNLLKLLRDEQILRANNEPYQSQLNNGRFTTVLTEKNGFSCSVTVMTPKGLKWLAGQLVDWGYIE